MHTRAFRSSVLHCMGLADQATNDNEQRSDPGPAHLTSYSPANSLTTIYIVEPINLTKASPATENKMNAIYPFTAALAPEVFAFAAV